MAAKPARLTTTRHGTFAIRWIVPARFRDQHGKPREVRFSLRTNDASKARILALEFNLALERLKSMSNDSDFSRQIAPFILQVGDVRIEVKDDDDQLRFNRFLQDHPDFRAKLLASIRSGVEPSAAMAELIGSVKAAVGAAAGAPSRFRLKDAVEKYLQSLPALSKNRRSTVGEKDRTLSLLLEHLSAQGRNLEEMTVQELVRPDLIDFIGVYASRRGKGGEGTEGRGSDNVTSAGSSKDGDAPIGLSPRTVMKAISHIKDFFDYALAKHWAASNPVDAAFDKATSGLRAGAQKAKSSHAYSVFDAADIRAIFEPRQYLANNRASDDFWAPLLGLYTGARLGEIVTLKLAAVVQDPKSRLFCLNVGTKNESSKRLVPVPTALIDLGFLDYIEHIRALGATALFPHRELNDTRKNDPSKHASRAFGVHLSKVGIQDPGYVFHSFRHTAITRMHVSGVPIGDSEMIVGHANQESMARQGSAGGGRSRPGGSTHIGTYVQAGAFEQEDLSLYARLKQHMDATLNFDIDVVRLRKAAKIVLEHTVSKGQGPTTTFKSGWHTNKPGYGAEMVKLLDA